MTHILPLISARNCDKHALQNRRGRPVLNKFGYLNIVFSVSVLAKIKSKRISNRHISCDVYIRSECGSCPADVATAARPRTATHDHGRFYSFINTISFHVSRRFIFTGSCSVYIIMRQLLKISLLISAAL